jgi:uncharacterized iron-regulated protein
MLVPMRTSSSRAVVLLLPALAALAASGCAGGMRRGTVRVAPAPVRTAAPEPARAVARGPYALYRGDGRPTTLRVVLEEARGADVVLLGEIHDHPQGSRAEKDLLDGLLVGSRPLALAMEFFERDQQAAVDAWAAGRMDEATFRKETKRPKAYETTHGPLMAAARAAGAPLIAANAPRRLVKSWRTSHPADYATWRAGLPEADRALVAREWSMPKDAYWQRFSELMGTTEDRFFRSQTLWDDTMAEAVADARAADPNRRVLLIVGGFHVTGRLGTTTKLLQRRPGDRVLVILMSETDRPDLAFDPEDRGTADVVLKIPHHERKDEGPNPHARPAHPAPAPATSSPQP